MAQVSRLSQRIEVLEALLLDKTRRYDLAAEELVRSEIEREETEIVPILSIEEVDAAFEYVQFEERDVI
jgi:hypothetical protein